MLIKKYLGCAANMGSKIRLLVDKMTPYKMQNLVYEWVDDSRVSQIFAKICLN